jgi:4-amino-4-deoxy-L-arabinose transferase-like glycosyltransferase
LIERMAPATPAYGRTITKLLTAAILCVAATFLAFHAVHLTADFPNHSPWMDWAKYTDEGWYGDAAIRHYQRGHWYVYGDFNPAAALPVWPALEFLLFRFTGVSLLAARAFTVAIFALTLLASFLLLRRWQTQSSPVTPAIAVLLLAVSPFCFVFTRMAILEPLLVLLTLLALLAASSAHAYPANRTQHLRPILILGLLLPLMILTKTTALFLFPAIAWLLFAATAYRIRPFLRTAIPAAALAAALWLAYFALVVRPHFLADYRYLFSANAYTGITLATAADVLHTTFADGLWIGNILYPLSLITAAVSLITFRRRTNPLTVALILWASGYAAFLAYHNNLQPRYYLVIAVPLTLLVPFAAQELLQRLPKKLLPLSTLAALAALLAIAIPDARETLTYIRTPEYTFTRAAAQLRQIIAAAPSQNPLVLSISGSDLSLMTGLPSICDDFGTMDLADRVAVYRPGWYLTWNQVDDDKMDALTPLFRLTRVAAFPVMDDPERNLLILYRLDPATTAAPPKHRRKPIPPLLRTRLGQQPSELQLEH